MSANLTLLIAIAGLYSAGIYLLLERSLTRVVLGILMMANATNLLLLSAAGPPGGPPLVGTTPNDEMTDPLVQALILTAIVITLGLAAFMLALIWRNWVLEQQEDIVDDVEDLRVAREGGIGDGEAELAPGEAEYDSGQDDVVREDDAVADGPGEVRR
jgi:multicomponent Na+:H+ antiporter subunit C